MLVNNAGWTLTTPFLEESEDYWRRVIDINLWGAVFCTRVALEWMVEHGGGVIVNVASDAGASARGAKRSTRRPRAA